MTEPRRYIHIGYPKCASTTLQADFFKNHPDVLHLGAGVGGYTGYIDDDITIAVEVDLRFRRDFGYDAERVQALFQGYFDKAAKEGKKAVGVSSEHFAFTYSNDIDVTQKARRLHAIFGDTNTSVIMIVRNQMDLLRALWGEHIREGYAGTFPEFLEYTWLFQDRNWALEFCFDRLYGTYTDLFGEENVHVHAFETIKTSQDAFTAPIFAAMGVAPQPIPLQKHNERMSPGALELMRHYNAQTKHTLSRPFYEPFHLHRMSPYFTKERGVGLPGRAALDFHLQMHLVALSKKLAGEAQGAQPEFPSEYRRRFSDIYAPSNRKFQELTGIDVASLGYPVEAT